MGRKVFASLALDLLFGRACQVELSARMRQDQFPSTTAMGPALLPAGKDSCSLVLQGKRGSIWLCDCYLTLPNAQGTQEIKPTSSPVREDALYPTVGGMAERKALLSETSSDCSPVGAQGTSLSWV